ncbi:MAG: hypothetical protein ACQETE_07365 [Bacteroidota bacterium]
MGVSWSPPADQETALQQLYVYQQAGITDIELDREISPSLFPILSEFDFRIHYRIDQPYWRAMDINQRIDNLHRQLNNVREHFADRLPLSTINILQHGAFQDTAFVRKWHHEANPSLTNQYGVDLIVQSNNMTKLDTTCFSGYRLTVLGEKIPDLNPDGSLPFRGAYLPSHIGSRQLKALWEATADSNQALNPIFFPSDWLNKIIAQNPDYTNVFRALSEQASLPFPTLNQLKDAPANQHNWSVLILTLLWLTIAIHYGFVPTYRRTISRYFFHHSFFVNDIMYRRYRAPYPAVTLIIQHALFVGLMLYTLHVRVWNSLSLDILESHWSWLTLLGPAPIGRFFITAVIIIALSFLLISWLYLSNRDLNHFSQPLMLFSWPLHTNFITVSVMVTSVMAGAGSLWIYSWVLITIVVALLAFFIAAIDLFQYTRKLPLIFGLASVGLYLSLITFGLILILSSSSFWQTIELALAYN